MPGRNAHIRQGFDPRPPAARPGRPPHRVAGTAVFMTGTGTGTPPTLLHNLEHNKVLHEEVVLLTVVTADVPHVAPEDRFRVEPLGEHFSG